MAEAIFDVVAEDPQIQHVPAEVDPPRVHEHGGEQRGKTGGRVGQEPTRNEGPLLHEGVAACELNQEEQNVHGDQRVSDEGKGSSTAVVVADGNIESLLSASAACPVPATAAEPDGRFVGLKDDL